MPVYEIELTGMAIGWVRVEADSADEAQATALRLADSSGHHLDGFEFMAWHPAKVAPTASGATERNGQA